MKTEFTDQEIESAMAGCEIDGSLRDIYINDTSLHDWNVFVGYLLEKFEGTLIVVDGQLIENVDFDALFREGETHAVLISLKICESVINGHFFMASEIELDFDPSDYQDQRKFRGLLEFCREISLFLQRRVTICPENCKEYVIWEFDPTL